MFCLDFTKAFDWEFYEDGDMLIRSVASPPFFFSFPLRPDSHLYSISIGRELLRKGPRNPYIKKAYPGPPQPFQTAVWETQKFSDFGGGGESPAQIKFYMKLYHVKQIKAHSTNINFLKSMCISFSWRVRTMRLLMKKKKHLNLVLKVTVIAVFTSASVLNKIVSFALNA